MRSAGVVLWQRIAGILEQEIADGAFAETGRLPPEAELAKRFAVNRHTLRRAVMALAETGLVSVQHGRGTFVRPAPRIDYPVGARTRFSEIISAQSRLPDGELLASREMPASPEVAEALGLPAETPVILLDILRRADGVPLSITSSHLPAARFRGIAQVFRETRSVTAALRRYEIADYRRRTTRIWTRMPDAEEALLLRQPLSLPVLVTESVNEDMEGRPIEYGIGRAAGQRFQVTVG